jgi:hypothetical protein
MISNELSWPHLRRPGPGPDYQQQAPRPFVQEDTLKTAEIQIERKFFVFALKENAKGRFLRITEDAGGRRSTIIIPSTGLDDFKWVVNEMFTAAKKTPSLAKQTGAAEDADSAGNR